MESCSANFIESKFPKKGEVDKNLTFYEMGSQEEGILSRLAWNKNEIPKTSRDSGSNSQPNGSMIHNNLGHIEEPWNISCNFKIQGETSIIVSKDDDEPKIAQ